MVHKKSEYQNQYKACIIKKNHEDYMRNVNLRNERREREYVHTPLVWGDSTEEDTTSSDSNDEAPSKVAQHQKLAEAEEHYQSLAEILTDSKSRLEAFKQSKHPEAHHDIVCVPEMEKVTMKEQETQTKGRDLGEQKQSDSDSDAIDLNKDQPNKPKCQASKVNQAELLTSEVKESRGTKQTVNDMRNSQFNLRRKPYLTSSSNKKQFLHVNKFKSRPSSKDKQVKHQTTKVDLHNSEAKVPPLKLNADLKEGEDHHGSSVSHRAESRLKFHAKPPFISYGIGDVEDCVSMHRTHNVKSLVDVYPTALKAKLRHDHDKKTEREKSARSRSAEELLEKLSGCRDNSSWESEYSKQFHGYEPKDYERALSARAVIPRCTSIPGVHRHGCLVVHVD